MARLPFLGGNSEVLTFWDIKVHLPLGCPFRELVYNCLKDVKVFGIWISLYGMEASAKF